MILVTWVLGWIILSLSWQWKNILRSGKWFIENINIQVMYFEKAQKSRHQAHSQLKIQSVPVFILMWSLILKSSNLIGWNITSFRLEKLKAQDLIYVFGQASSSQQQQELLQLRFLRENAFLHFRAVGKRGGQSPLRVLQISYSYLSWKTNISSVPPGF